jgi:hypothetical protein
MSSIVVSAWESMTALTVKHVPPGGNPEFPARAGARAGPNAGGFEPSSAAVRFRPPRAVALGGHVGYSQPIDGVVAYPEHVSPSGVGDKD